MQIIIRGVRGSIPTTAPDASHYGGNTSCVVVLEENWMLVMDGGSGMQREPAAATQRTELTT